MNFLLVWHALRSQASSSKLKRKGSDLALAAAEAGMAAKQRKKELANTNLDSDGFN